MSTKLLITIAAEPGSPLCGECYGPDLIGGMESECDWRRWDYGSKTFVRDPKCIAAETKQRNLVMAGEGLRRLAPTSPGEAGIARLLVERTWDSFLEKALEE